MPIDPDVQDEIDRLDARIDNLRQLAIASFADDELRLDELEERQETDDARWRRLRDRLGEDESILGAVARALGVSPEALRAAIVWVTMERAKARASRN